MNVTIPPEFATFAREQVEAGAFASEEEVVAGALREHLARLDALRADLAPALVALDRGEEIDGETLFAEIEAELESRLRAQRR